MILLDDIFIYPNENMPSGATEMVCKNEDNTYTILVNCNLTAERQTEAVWHAISHIQNNDFERVEEYGIQKIESQAHKMKGGTQCGQ